MKNLPSTTIQSQSNNRAGKTKPTVSVVIPAYNEAKIVEENLATIVSYMQGLEDRYAWELVVINDGSDDDTGLLIDNFAKSYKNIKTLHHLQNFKLGKALRYAFENCESDYIVTLDMDLSYAPEHIERLLETIISQQAKIVIASPYSKGGQISNVPRLRKVFSIWANRFLSLTARGRLTTITGMVRAYDRKFLQSLSLKTTGVDIHPEIIYKAQLLGALITEIPAHLNWYFQKQGQKRQSSLHIFSTIMSCLDSGFFFRPFMFFIVFGVFLFTISFYPLGWAFIHTVDAYHNLPASSRSIDYRFSEAMAAAFDKWPHSFVIGGFSILIAVQFISLGIISLQNKRYFEELFHLTTQVYKSQQDNNP